MPQWAGSCWYYLRFINPTNDAALISRELQEYWLPVDLYVGGAEHAVLHLRYARFWHKVLFDIGVVSTTEPFQKLVSQGMILGETEFTVERESTGAGAFPAGVLETVKLSADDVLKKGDGYVRQKRRCAQSDTALSLNFVFCGLTRYVLKSDPLVRVTARAHKMSKSRGNVINPDDVVAAYGAISGRVVAGATAAQLGVVSSHARLTGADSLRLYEMFLGPLRETKVWNTRSVDGVYRFLGRTWRLVDANTAESAESQNPTSEQLRTLHTTIKKVTGEQCVLSPCLPPR